MVPSDEAEKSNWSSGDRASPFTLLVWPLRLVTMAPDVIEYMEMVGSSLPTANIVS